MPIIKVTQKGKVGFKFGQSGKVFMGAGGKAKALNQGRAIKASQQGKR